jgi:hypothetical protein
MANSEWRVVNGEWRMSESAKEREDKSAMESAMERGRDLPEGWIRAKVGEICNVNPTVHYSLINLPMEIPIAIQKSRLKFTGSTHHTLDCGSLCA